ncbi:hydantoinase B/oxoprolinase family protein [Candidatus Bipolaricaulota bacterium]
MREATIDAVTLEVIRHALTAVAEEMNANLVRTAFSPNIKERRDCSCAVFDGAGRMIAQAESIPVHLGAMPASVEAAVDRVGDLRAGDVVVVNDPYAGGAHLPDITFVAPVFDGSNRIGYVANRAHHADVGGKEPGSLAGDAREIYQEGLRIPPVRLWKEGELDRDLSDLILLNVRTPEERRGDLRAQFAACQTGIERLRALVDRYGCALLARGMEAILDYSERRMRREIERLPNGDVTFEDVLDDDGVSGEAIRLRATVRVDGDRMVIDFAGSSPQVAGPVNAVYAVTRSASYYAVRAMTDPEIPPNAGCYRPIEVIVPAGSVVCASPPAPVVGGNLETSQRIVDVILGALGRILPEAEVAASQGTMNNVAIGGIDPRSGRAYTLYETIAGGWGARPEADGVDGMHSHMTNTLNTPVEALEVAYPLRVERYELIPGSGGAGRHRGGLGIRRDLTAVGHDARGSVLADRRTHRPYGAAGGAPGSPGANVLVEPSGEEKRLAAKTSFSLPSESAISIRTPGGGGYGDPEDRAKEAVDRDVREGRV